MENNNNKNWSYNNEVSVWNKTLRPGLAETLPHETYKLCTADYP